MVGWRMKTARTVMFAQAVASLGIWVVQVSTTSVRFGHNQEVPGTVWLVLVTNPVITALVALAAVFLTRRSWARGLAVAMEVVGVVSALVSVSTGYYQALIAIALAVGVVTLVTTSAPRPTHA
jgi:glucan phosphoethanolaminetransferase (alkaline phosphatase superfamily)